MFPVFNLLLTPFYGPLALYTLHRRFVKGKSAQSFAGQWGQVTPAMRDFGRTSAPRIWIHAVSVGETVAVRPIIAALRQQLPHAKIALSNTTDTGHELAEKLLESGEVDLIFYFPLDLPPVLQRVLAALEPDALCLVETELWPNLLHLARKRGVSTFLLNGRVSDNLLKNAPKAGPLWKWLRGNVSQFLMRGESDAARLKQLGVPDEQITVVGDVKLESPTVDAAQARQLWRERLAASDAPLFIAGSTHPGEESQILAIYQNLKADFPDLRLGMAPRHVERAASVAQEIEAAGFKLAHRSQNESLKDNDAIYLLDSVGELADFFAAAEVAFVGGSLISRGGHNVLEPVLRGVPVLFGPSMDNFRAAKDLVLANDLGLQIEGDAQQIAAQIAPFLRAQSEPQAHADFLKRADEVLSPHRGAATRMASCIVQSIVPSSASN